MKLKLILILISATVLSACTSVSSFNYNQNVGRMTAFNVTSGPLPTVSVLPFNDTRDYESTNALALGFIPLLPYGYTEKDQPEVDDLFVTIGRFKFDPNNDLARAANESLKYSRLFSKVDFAPNIQAAQSDYVFSGTLENSTYEGTLNSYFISYFFAPALWVIGFPTGSSTNELEVVFELIDTKTKQVVVRVEYDNENTVYHFLYAGYGTDTLGFAKLMRQAMNKMVERIHKAELNKSIK